MFILFLLNWAKGVFLLYVFSGQAVCWKYSWYILNIRTFLSVVTHHCRVQRVGFYIRLFWCCLLCGLKEFLDLKVLSQRLQGMMIPSRWFASMWSFMFLLMPSFPHTLHRSAKRKACPLEILFWLFSIIDFIFSSSSSKSPELFPGMANVLFSPRSWIFLLAGVCLFGILTFAGGIVGGRCFSSSL